MTELINITGWQPHTVRGVISGVLRKKLRLNVICEKSVESGQGRYRIVAPEGNA